MKLFIAFVVALTSSVLAEGVQARVHGNHQYLPQPFVEDSTALGIRCSRSVARDTDKEHRVVTDGTWSGAIIFKKLCAGNFVSVTGRFTIPIPKHTCTSNDTEKGSAWVGISNYTYGSMLQAGVDWEVERSGNVTYSAWYEWVPYLTTYLDDFEVRGGDVMQVDIATTTPTTANVRLINVSTGKDISIDATAAPDSFLTGDNAEWVMEDFSDEGKLPPLADFGEVVFTNASAKTSTGWVEDLGGATIINMVQDGKLVVDTHIPSLSQIAIKYVK
ncbi:hypothetical protein COCMIDRAFT_28071 [Bipolaris oryzae ATCC 44560]|uniref:Uncharacterized protein n=1 Tax=Bipolaris oryzae ATCC 44560 TaxID=930090 RepID=W6Z194_COCMI|nr:uncharacterized protein COCMIDRAFT_28071 [Bipolaris oryzae ATCC 44560]EUC43478.1 hypothetical protein COCMIDRAFT_28071 [Bipolaris oryzae ATCC 44560]